MIVSGVTPAQAFILGASLTNLHHFTRRRHPVADRPLVDFPTATLFVPAQLLGTQIGVLCNRIWPGWLITVCLIVFLGFLCKRTFYKVGPCGSARLTGNTGCGVSPGGVAN